MTQQATYVPRLVVLTPHRARRRVYPLVELTVYEIGRAPGSHIRLQDEEAALNHARIFRNGSEYILYALSDTKPTCVNGQPVKKALLSEDDRIQLGNTELLFQWVSPEKLRELPEELTAPPVRKEDPPPQEPDRQPPAPIEAEKAAQPPQQEKTACLSVVAGENQGAVFELPPGCRLKIGRATSSDIRLSDLKVSREHCLIEERNGAWFVTDLGSANGIVVNGERIHKTALGNNDFIRLGFTVLKFRCPSTETTGGA